MRTRVSTAFSVGACATSAAVAAAGLLVGAGHWAAGLTVAVGALTLGALTFRETRRALSVVERHRSASRVNSEPPAIPDVDGESVSNDFISLDRFLRLQIASGEQSDPAVLDLPKDAPARLTVFIPLPDRWSLPQGWTYARFTGAPLPGGLAKVHARRYSIDGGNDRPHGNYLRVQVGHIGLAELDAFPNHRAVIRSLGMENLDAPAAASGPWEQSVAAVTTIVPAMPAGVSQSTVVLGVIDDALAVIKDLQIQWVMKTNQTLQFVNRSLLPLRIMCEVVELSARAPSSFLGDVALGTSSRNKMAWPVPGGEDTLRHFSSELHADPWLNPITPFLALHNEARVAVDDRGDYRSGVVLTDLACEVLFDTLLMMISWELSDSPEECATKIVRALNTRVKTYFAPHLGGSWDTRSDGVIGEWRKHVSLQRHRAVHSNALVTVEQAEHAVSLGYEVKAFVFDRLAADGTRRRFPRSALLLAGRSGLEKRNAWVRRLRDLEPEWPVLAASYSDYRDRVVELSGRAADTNLD